jgi:hypothetical protein
LAAVPEDFMSVSDVVCALAAATTIKDANDKATVFFNVE